MRHSKDDFIRIPFVVMRSNKKVREWFRGAMLYVHRNPSWYLRIFEIDGRASKGARVLDFGNQEPDSRHLVCGVRGVTERASTQDPKGSGRLVALARAFIAKKACEDSALNQDLIAAHLGVSVRTLQLRFKESKFERTSEARQPKAARNEPRNRPITIPVRSDLHHSSHLWYNSRFLKKERRL